MAEAGLISLATGFDVPNSALPVRLYRGAFKGQSASDIERQLAGNGWTGAWRNGIYPFTHYHSTAHEVLVIASGEVNVMLGGEDGQAVALNAGDAVVLPAGTGHRNEGSSPDLLVIGAYDRGRDWDVCRPGQTDLRAALKRIADLPGPRLDPVTGQTWQSVNAT